VLGAHRSRPAGVVRHIDLAEGVRHIDLAEGVRHIGLAEGVRHIGLAEGVRHIGLVEGVRHIGLAEELRTDQGEEPDSFAVVEARHIGLDLEMGTVPEHHTGLEAAVCNLAGRHTDLGEGHVLEVGHTDLAAHCRGLVVAVGHMVAAGSHLAVHRTVGFALVAVSAGSRVVEVVDIALAVRILAGLLEGISRRSRQRQVLR
jgi:hypothetical protein